MPGAWQPIKAVATGTSRHPGASIRAGQRDDVAALAAIDQLVNPRPWTVSQFEAACSGVPGACEEALVAAGPPGVLGFVVFSQVMDECCLHNIAVHPARQGQGLGQALLAAALARMQAAGATSCYLEVRVSNVAARGLYERFSFALDGLRKNYYPCVHGREDALLMSKRL